MATKTSPGRGTLPADGTTTRHRTTSLDGASAKIADIAPSSGLGGVTPTNGTAPRGPISPSDDRSFRATPQPSTCTVCTVRTRHRAWEIRAQSAIDEIRAMTHCACQGHAARSSKRRRTLADIEHQLDAAERYLNRRPTPATWLRGTRLEGSWGHIHNARALAIDVMDGDQLTAFAPRVLTLADKYLRHGSGSFPEPTLLAIAPWFDRLDIPAPAASGSASDDPPRARSRQQKRARSLTQSGRSGAVSPAPQTPDGARVVLGDQGCSVDPSERFVLAAALRECYDRVGNEYHRLRRFQAIMVITTMFILLLVIGLVTAGWHWPGVVPMCFPDPSAVVQPAPVGPAVCPTGPNGTPSSGDVAIVVLFGLLGSALASVRLIVRPAAASLIPMGATRWFQMLLKASAGMLTALLGVMFLRAGVVPGFTQADTQAQILAYAIVFGASQELITKFVDQRSNDLLEAATTSEHSSSGRPPPRGGQEDRWYR